MILMSSVLREGSDYEILPSGAVKMMRDLTVSDFCEMLDLYDLPGTDIVDVLIVKIKYKYDHETEWTIDNEIMEPCIGYSGDVWTWLNDWDEGQQQQYVLGWIALSDLEVTPDE